MVLDCPEAAWSRHDEWRSFVGASRRATPRQGARSCRRQRACLRTIASHTRRSWGSSIVRPAWKKGAISLNGGHERKSVIERTVLTRPLPSLGLVWGDFCQGCRAGRLLVRLASDISSSSSSRPAQRQASSVGSHGCVPLVQSIFDNGDVTEGSSPSGARCASRTCIRLTTRVAP